MRNIIQKLHNTVDNVCTVNSKTYIFVDTMSMKYSLSNIATLHYYVYVTLLIYYITSGSGNSLWQAHMQCHTVVSECMALVSAKAY